jgi:hypothetical protein
MNVGSVIGSISGGYENSWPGTPSHNIDNHSMLDAGLSGLRPLNPPRAMQFQALFYI